MYYSPLWTQKVAKNWCYAPQMALFCQIFGMTPICQIYKQQLGCPTGNVYSTNNSSCGGLILLFLLLILISSGGYGFLFVLVVVWGAAADLHSSLVTIWPFLTSPVGIFAFSFAVPCLSITAAIFWWKTRRYVGPWSPAILASKEVGIVAEINSRIQRSTPIPLIIGVASCAIVVVIFVQLLVLDISTSVRTFLMLESVAVFVLGMSTAWVMRRRERLLQITPLRYKLDRGKKEKFIAFRKALADLAGSARLWHVISDTPNWDWKRSAGATSVIARKQVAVKPVLPPYIKSNVKIPYSLTLDTLQFFFFPDKLFLFQEGTYGMVDYTSVRVQVQSIIFVEDQGVPSDANIVGYTWQYVRKDGGPDLRFSRNKQIPKVEYGCLDISSQSGLNLRIYVSDLARAQRFAHVFSSYIFSEGTVVI